MHRLKPCPFCGGEAYLVEAYGRNGERVFVECGSCEAIGEWFDIGHDKEAIDAWNQRFVDGETSDGYHTFNELYHHRAVLFAKVVGFAGERAWKSKLHADGSMFDGYFIVGVETPEGQATYHYEIDPYWEMFDCKEVEHAPVWDGHTSQEAIARIEHWSQRAERTCKPETIVLDSIDIGVGYLDRLVDICSECEESLTLDYSSNTPQRGVLPNYCPNCGARVVGDSHD